MKFCCSNCNNLHLVKNWRVLSESLLQKRHSVAESFGVLLCDHSGDVKNSGCINETTSCCHDLREVLNVLSGT